MLFHALVLAGFAAGMATVLYLSCTPDPAARQQADAASEEPAEPPSLRAAA